MLGRAFESLTYNAELAGLFVKLAGLFRPQDTLNGNKGIYGFNEHNDKTAQVLQWTRTSSGPLGNLHTRQQRTETNQANEHKSTLPSNFKQLAMVSLRHIQDSNRSRTAQPKTAVFVGATSGIGLAAIKCLLRATTGSRLFIVGRSLATFGSQLSQLQAIDTGATITIIEAQISLLKEVKRTCAVILKDAPSLDLLWLSQGGLGLRERDSLTDEGLPVDFAVSFYGRILFMRELAPLIAKSTDGRVLSVLCAGMEGRVNIADPGLRQEENYAAAGFWGAQKQGVTMMSLVMQELAAQHPTVSFIHTNPGMVSTDVHEKWSAMFTGRWTPLAWLIKILLIPLTYLVGFTPDQAGETGVFEILDEKFCSQTHKNFFRLDEHAAEVGNAGRRILEDYCNDGTGRRICEHTWDVFSDV